MAEDDEGHEDRDPDERAAHGRRAGLGLVALGALLADVLAELVAAQPADEPGADGSMSTMATMLAAMALNIGALLARALAPTAGVGDAFQAQARARP